MGALDSEESQQRLRLFVIVCDVTENSEEIFGVVDREPFGATAYYFNSKVFVSSTQNLRVLN